MDRRALKDGRTPRVRALTAWTRRRLPTLAGVLLLGADGSIYSGGELIGLTGPTGGFVLRFRAFDPRSGGISGL